MRDWSLGLCTLIFLGGMLMAGMVQSLMFALVGILALSYVVVMWITFTN